MELTLITGELMPSGKPDLLAVKHYTPIVMLIKRGEIDKSSMFKLLLLLLKDYCLSMNVVRNMTENQMIEAAGMMLEECDDWRVVELVVVFSEGERGKVGGFFLGI